MAGSRLEEKKPFWTKKKLLWAVLSLCICVMVAALVYIGIYLQQYFMQKGIEERIGNQFSQIKSNMPVVVPSPSPSTETQSPADPSPEDTSPIDELTDWQKERLQLISLEILGKQAYADILATNPDFRGMVSVPGLGINTPYVLGTDNDYYLNHSFEGKNSAAGTVFMHCENDRLLMDRNSVLFGHNMKTGAMFARLMDYKNANTYKTAPVITLDGLTGETVWIVFAAYVTEPDWGYIETNPNDEHFAAMLDEIQARSMFITDVDVNENDRILTLSTCTYEAEDLRFAVHARLLRPGEEIPEEVKVEKNTDQKPYNKPSEMKMSEIEFSNVAVMQYPSRTYYYQPREAGIDWYSGNSSIVQGMYTNFKGKVKKDSFLSAVYHADEKKTYLALDRYNNQKGIVLLTNRLPSGNMNLGSTVTPAGIDARYPSLTLDNGTIWLLYTVVRDDGEDVYKLMLKEGKASGEPELLMTAPAGSRTRPLGYYTVDGVPLLFWHETVNKTVYGVWQGNDPFIVTLAGDADRVTVYGTLSGGKIKASTEKKGKLTFAAIDLSAYPKPVTPSPDEPVVETTEEPAEPVSGEGAEVTPEETDEGDAGSGVEDNAVETGGETP